MLSYSVYKIVHLVGIFLLFAALGALSALSAKGALAEGGPARKLASAAHGTALILVLVGGMGSARPPRDGGQLADVGLAEDRPLVVMGAVIVAIRRAGSGARDPALPLPLLGALAAWLAIYKPGSGPV